MIRDILSKFNIDCASFVPASLCRAANQRLFFAVPENANVVFMLFPYFCGDSNKKLSAYGAVYDYHGFAKEVFTSLEAYINEKYPNRFVKGYSDHSPYLECEGAALAGLGIIGKNSLLITEKYSSYVFIAELVTTLTADELILEGIGEGKREIRYCEGCNACVKACPAGCAGSSDRESCISSLTQKKGELNEEERLLLKRHPLVWGCDACLLACPHANQVEKTPIPFFKTDKLYCLTQEMLEAMDEETFASRAYSWRKRETILRNLSLHEN